LPNVFFLNHTDVGEIEDRLILAKLTGLVVLLISSLFLSAISDAR